MGDEASLAGKAEGGVAPGVVGAGGAGTGEGVEGGPAAEGGTSAEAGADESVWPERGLEMQNIASPSAEEKRDNVGFME